MFSKARVVIGSPRGDWGDTPYTIQPGGCGVEGDYIHFTPNYILKPESSEDFTHKPGKIRCFSKLQLQHFTNIRK